MPLPSIVSRVVPPLCLDNLPGVPAAIPKSTKQKIVSVEGPPARSRTQVLNCRSTGNWPQRQQRSSQLVSNSMVVGAPRHQIKARKANNWISRSKKPFVMMTRRKIENLEKRTVWERLYDEASTRAKAQRVMQDRLALEKEALASANGRRFKSHHWEAKWRKMVDHHKGQKEERQRLHEHLEYQRLLEEFKECTFHPRRFTSDTLRGPESQHVMQSLVELVKQQKQLKSVILRCNEEEELLDEYIKTTLCNPSSQSAEETQSVADSIRDEIITRYRELLERRLDILHQATQLDTTHYQYLVLSGITETTTGFDEDFVSQLRKTEWSQQGAKCYPTMKFDSTIASYLHQLKKQSQQQLSLCQQSHNSYQRLSNEAGNMGLDNDIQYPSQEEEEFDLNSIEVPVNNGSLNTTPGRSQTFPAKLLHKRKFKSVITPQKSSSKQQLSVSQFNSEKESFTKNNISTLTTQDTLPVNGYSKGSREEIIDNSKELERMALSNVGYSWDCNSQPFVNSSLVKTSQPGYPSTLKFSGNYESLHNFPSIQHLSMFTKTPDFPRRAIPISPNKLGTRHISNEGTNSRNWSTWWQNWVKQIQG